jgi:DNA-directed RNA polymerase specialized sigma24 family protein
MPTKSAVDLIADPQVVLLIAGILRADRVATQDLEDEIGNVQRRMLKSLRNKLAVFWPVNVDEMKGLAVTCTRSQLVDRFRVAKRKRKIGDVGNVVEDPDAHAASSRRASERDPLDHQKLVTFLDEHLKKSPKADIDARIFEGWLNDEDQAEIAKAVGLSHQQIRDRVRSIRALLYGELAVLAATTAAVFLWLRSPNIPDGPHFYPHGDDVALRDATPLELAADLRERARPRCQKAQWNDCLPLINAAAWLDPEGDRAPAIQAVRDRAATEIEDNLRERESKFGPPPPRPKAPKQAPKAPEQR